MTLRIQMITQYRVERSEPENVLKPTPVKIICVVGARPNFMKVAPILRALQATARFEPLLLHTGQHYDYQMSQVFFDELGLPPPDIYLGVGSASHALQTAQIMVAFEGVLRAHQPDLLLVVGDVNSTLACALVAAKSGVKIAHVEAGLRSFNRRMPEEINRILTDALSDLLFVTEQSAVENLHREGVEHGRIHFVGNVMVDTLHWHLEAAHSLNTLRDFGVDPQGYALLTLHRPANVDDDRVLERLLAACLELSRSLPVVFPLHPRTRRQIENAGLDPLLQSAKTMVLCPPLGYLQFLHLMAHARMVLTDSGGVQEESTVLGVPCLTLREETERPVTVTEGTNVIVGSDSERIRVEAERILRGQGRAGRIPEKWDGRAAERIAAILVDVFSPVAHS